MPSKALKMFVLLIIMLVTPAMAQAVWYVAASTSPSSGAGTISNPGTVSYADSVLSADYTVTPASGYRISVVRVNGATLAPKAGTTNIYTVPKSSSTQSLVAYLTAVTYSVTPTISGGGAIIPNFTSPAINALQAGKDYTFNIVPNAGNMIYDVKVDGVSQGPISSYTFRAISESHTIWASFGTTPKVTASALPTTSQTTGLGPEYGVTLDASQSTTTVGTLSYSWRVTATNPTGLSGGSFSSPNGVNTLFYADKTGDYTITMTASDGLGHSASTSVKVSAVTRQYYQSQSCTCCHIDYSPVYVQQYWASAHASTGATPVSCQSCHAPQFTSHYTIQLPFDSCVPCHNTYTPEVMAGYNASPHGGVSCTGCHDSHALAVDFTANFCQRCHRSVFAVNAPHYGLEAVMSTSCSRCHTPHTFISTAAPQHFNGYTSYSNPAYAAAYVTSRTSCGDCHKGGDPATSEDQAIAQYRTDWMASGHGRTDQPPWKNSGRHNWKSAGTAGSSAATNSVTEDCVRCHSSAGYRQFLSNGKLDPVGSLSDRTSEPLACSACHNQDFSVRSVAATTSYYNYSSGAGKVIVSRANPDLKKSNLCINCHSGRVSGATIQAMAAKAAQSRYSTGFWGSVAYLDGHYLSAGGQLLGNTGYQYPGQSYGNFAIDHSSVLLTEGAGPCVACHMQNKSHSFGATVSALCGNCHRQNPMTEELLNARRDQFNATLKALSAALAKKGFTPVVDAQGKLAYPYFANTNWGGANEGAGNMGAAFNLSLLTHDPGAYVHNPGYTKRVLRDSIDWLENGSVDREKHDLTSNIAALLGDPAESGKADSFLSGAGNASASCYVCHSGDEVDGKNIVETYNQSLHSQRGNGATCASCHAPSDQVAHPPTAMATSTSQISANCLNRCHVHSAHSWESVGICTRCHEGHNPKQVTLSYPHFSTYSTAQYIATGISCDNCHTTEDQFGELSFNIYTANVQWARSGKGNPRSPSYIAYDFKALGTAGASQASTAAKNCVKCHTTTGYQRYVDSGFRDISPFGKAGDQPGGDRTREMIGCSACHEPTPFLSFEQIDWETDSVIPAFSRRDVPTVTAYYNYSAAGVPRAVSVFPMPSDAYASNNCIVCHSGTVAGSTLKKYASKFTPAGSFWNNVPFIAPHGTGAAGMIYQSTGYTYTAAGRSYSNPYYGHTAAGGIDRGPCVGCHMSTPKPHLFSPISSAAGTVQKITAFESICKGCHIEMAVDVDVNVMNRDREGFASSLKALEAVLAARGIYFNAKVAPYFFNTGEAALQGSPGSEYRRWNALYQPGNPALYQGVDLMGAAFNLMLLTQEQGAYTHNDYYAKRLIYDSIDLVDDGKQNNSVYDFLQNYLATTAGYTPDDKSRALLYVGTRP